MKLSGHLFYTLMLLPFTVQAQETFNFEQRQKQQRTRDSILISSNLELISQKPDSSNAKLYYKVADALTQLERFDEAIPMMQNIVDSDLPVYNAKYYMDFDTPYDSLVIRAYGGYVMNYKHYACEALTTGFLAGKVYDRALHYLSLYDTLYPVSWGCGTSYHMAQTSIDNYYYQCYEGLGMVEEALNRLAKRSGGYYVRSFDAHRIVAKLLQSKYSEERLKEELKKAEASLVFTPDSVESISYVYNNYPDDVADTVRYTSGSATLQFMGRTFDIKHLGLEDGEVATRQTFIDVFRSWQLYRNLDGTENESNWTIYPPINIDWGDE